MTSPVRLSVLVTARGEKAHLARCLDAVLAQPEPAEVVVADGSPEPFAAGGDPRLRVIHLPGARSVPELRWTALRATSGHVVAAVEHRCVPDPGWCATLLAAHAAHPEAAAIGGPVRLARGAGVVDVAVYLVEYGLFAPPLPEAEAHDLSGANLSWKREALEAHGDLLDAGAWETLIHARFRRDGRPIRLSSAGVTFHNAMSFGTALAQRFHYGRGYAADRLAGAGPGRRLLYGVATLLLPGLLLARLARAARRGHLVADLLRSLPVTCVLIASWSAGEATGYLFGPPRARRMF